MDTVREQRLDYELERMLELQGEHGLIRFRCADLSSAEAKAYLASSMSWDVVESALPGFLSPEAFKRKFPTRAPEKYLIHFGCGGLMKNDAGQIVRTDNHRLEVVFGLDYPSRPPRLVWLTSIWHPNILKPYLCTEGRPFAIGTALADLCLDVGAMVQYRNYNVADPLNREAAEWAKANPRSFPVDPRSLLDARENARALAARPSQDHVPASEDGRRSSWHDLTNSPLIEIL